MVLSVHPSGKTIWWRSIQAAALSETTKEMLRHWSIKGRVSIDERPGIVYQRSCIGEGEADTLIGKEPYRTTQEVTAVIVKRLMPLAALVKILIYDNGKEFATHQ